MSDPRVKKYIPQALNDVGRIREKVLRRAGELYSGEMLSKLCNRIEKELKVLKNKETAFIFVIIEELMNKCGLSSFDISVGGDAASLMICYLMGISNYDPINITPYFSLYNKDGFTFSIKVPANKYSYIVNKLNELEGIEKVVRVDNFRGGLLLIPKNICADGFFDIRHDNFGEYIDSAEYLDKRDLFYKLDVIPSKDLQLLDSLKTASGDLLEDIDTAYLDILKLFYSTESLGFNEQEIKGVENGIIGIQNLTELLNIEMPRNIDFDDICRLKGLLLGGDTYCNNAKILMEQDGIDISEIVTTKEDMFDYLLRYDVPEENVLSICNKIAAGNGLCHGDEETLLLYGVPQYYIDSCKKIKYLHSRALVSSDIIVDFMLLYFKLHYSEIFYAEYINIFGSDKLKKVLACNRYEEFLAYKEQIERQHISSSAYYEEYYNILVVQEMYRRNRVVVKYPKDRESDGAKYYTLEEIVESKDISSDDKIWIIHDKLCTYLFQLELHLNIFSDEEFENVVSKIKKIRDAIWKIK